MASGRIKGITIEIEGKTDKLNNALKGIDGQLNKTQRSLKDVDKLLKLNPGNTELLSQKYKTLQQEIQATKEKLNTLKEASKQADQALKDGTISQEQYDALQREIAETEQSLKSLEQECAQLLGQANLTLKEYEKKTGLDYAGYEKLVAEAQVWYQYQQILLDVMREIGELSYALNLGAVSRENCSAMFLPYARQADEAQEALKAWHRKTGAALEIDLDENRRRLQGVEGFFMNIPAIFNGKLHYRELPERTASMIAKQSAGQRSTALQHETDRFQKDVCLIVKDGKLYYLPEEQEKEA